MVRLHLGSNAIHSRWGEDARADGRRLRSGPGQGILECDGPVKEQWGAERDREVSTELA